MTDHTPGPWAVEVGPNCCFHSGNRVAVTKWDKDGDEDTNVTIAEVWPTSDDQDVADGHLIAAAPDLLDALHYAVDTLLEGAGGRDDQLSGSERTTIAIARAAIAKAEGQS